MMNDIIIFWCGDTDRALEPAERRTKNVNVTHMGDQENTRKRLTSDRIGGWCSETTQDFERA